MLAIVKWQPTTDCLGVYKYFSGAGEVYKYLSGVYKYFSGAGEVYKYFSGMVYINTSPALEKCI